MEPVSQGADSPKTWRTFTLSNNLREGTLHDEYKNYLKKMRKPARDRIHINDNLAGAISHYYAYTKTRKAINDIARQYKGIKTVPEARVQALNDEMKFVEARKEVEKGFF